jgi:pyruvate/2-oxoglutarate dehydrogenase complex dihydrolipoamide acyltransferase (E2) component
MRTCGPLSVGVEVDVTGPADVGLSTVVAAIIAGVAAGLRRHGQLNASLDIDAGALTFHAVENIGLLVETSAGPAIPVLHDASSLTPTQIAEWVADVWTRAGDFEPDELTGGTLTVSTSSARVATALLNQPQVAALCIGAPSRRPAAHQGGIALRELVDLTLVYDHRAVDSTSAAAFLSAVKAHVETQR